MFRSAAARTVGRSLTNLQSSRTLLQSRTTFNGRLTGLRTASSKALTMHRPVMSALVRHASSVPPVDAKPDQSAEAAMARQKLQSDPTHVSTTSSVHPVFSEAKTENPANEVDMMAGVKSDIKTIKETFSLESVPPQALYVGMAGVVPYVATSLSTVFLAWNINHAAATGSGFFLSGAFSEQLLHVIEPLQIGYGACIISFLGAIHWGLEWAKFGGEYGIRRYLPGIMAPAIAWPTTFLPVEYALIAQFLGFNYLYFVDSRAAKHGLAPRWYGVYRYVLTFVVGASIVISLIGRGQIATEIGKPSNNADRFKALRDTDWVALEEEERAKNAELADEEDEEEEGDEGGDKEESSEDED